MPALPTALSLPTFFWLLISAEAVGNKNPQKQDFELTVLVAYIMCPPIMAGNYCVLPHDFRTS